MNSALQNLVNAVSGAKEIPRAIKKENPTDTITLEQINTQLGGTVSADSTDSTVGNRTIDDLTNRVGTISSLGMFKKELLEALSTCKQQLQESIEKSNENTKLYEETTQKQDKYLDEFQKDILKLKIEKSALEVLCEQRITDLKKEFETKFNSTRNEQEIALKKKLKELDKDVDAIKQQKDKEIKNLTNECKLKLEIQRFTMQKLCDEQMQLLNTKISDLNSEKGILSAKSVETQQMAIADLESKYNKSILECNVKAESYKTLYETQIEALNAEIATNKLLYEKQITELNNKCDLRVKILKATMEEMHQKQIADVGSGHTSSLTQTQQALQNECNLKIEIMKATIQKLCDEQMQSLEKTIDDLKKELTTKEAENKALNASVTNSATAIANLKLEHDKSILECNIKLKALEELQTEKERKITTLQNQISALNTANEQLKNNHNLQIEILKAIVAKSDNEKIIALQQKYDLQLKIQRQAMQKLIDEKPAIEPSIIQQPVMETPIQSVEQTRTVVEPPNPQIVLVSQKQESVK